MNQCCTVDNVKLATGDGNINCQVNCLTCVTCGAQFTFTYHHRNNMNATYSFVKLAVEREKEKLNTFGGNP